MTPNVTYSLKATGDIETHLRATSTAGINDTKVSAYVIRSVQGIASAVLYMTQGATSAGALTKDLERAAVDLVRTAVTCAYHHEARGTLAESLTRTARLLEVAAITRVVSASNAHLLIGAHNDLIDYLSSTGYFAGHVFVPDTVDSERPPSMHMEKGTHTERQSDTGFDEKDTYRTTPVGHYTPTGVDVKGHERTPRSISKGHYVEKVQRAQKDRRAVILGMLQQKDRISIKDVTAVIKDVSEKTVQRELLALVEQGVLKKEGERRWSTYTLA